MNAKLKKLRWILPMLILGAVVAGVVLMQPVHSLTVDVNPSLEIVTNRLDRVLEINPMNENAKEMLEGFEPKDKRLESTINDLVDLMILTGYIRGGDDNYVLITVNDDSMDSELVDRVNKAIAAMLQNKQMEATIINQAIEKDDDQDRSTGVELAAQRLHEMDPKLTMEVIGDMTVRELVQYSRNNGIPLENLFKVAMGEMKEPVNDPEYIGFEEARRIALEKVNGEIIKFELDDLDDDDGPTYEFEIMLDGIKHEIDIDAKTGAIIEFDLDDDRYDDDDDDYDDDRYDDDNDDDDDDDDDDDPYNDDSDDDDDDDNDDDDDDDDEIDD